jgi:hypothetical protein
MPATGWVTSPTGLVLGGATACLADFALGAAMHTTVAPGTAVAPTDLRVQFIRPVPGDGRRVTARATVVHRAAGLCPRRSNQQRSEAAGASQCLGTGPAGPPRRPLRRTATRLIRPANLLITAPATGQNTGRTSQKRIPRQVSGSPSCWLNVRRRGGCIGSLTGRPSVASRAATHVAARSSPRSGRHGWTVDYSGTARIAVLDQISSRLVTTAACRPLFDCWDLRSRCWHRVAIGRLRRGRRRRCRSRAGRDCRGRDLVARGSACEASSPGSFRSCCPHPCPSSTPCPTPPTPSGSESLRRLPGLPRRGWQRPRRLLLPRRGPLPPR